MCLHGGHEMCNSGKQEEGQQNQATGILPPASCLVLVCTVRSSTTLPYIFTPHSLCPFFCSLPFSMTISLTLFCVVHGDSPTNAFSVKISGSEAVDELRNLIKAKKPVDFKDIDADRLTLWRVFIPVTLGTRHYAVTLDTYTQSQDGLLQPEELLPTARLQTLYPEGAPEEAIHIIVQRPAQGT